jgi:oleate hydratase
MPATARRCHIVGAGIAGLASAVSLLRDGGVPGTDIHLLEAAPQPGGSLDAAGSAEHGYAMRGSRMFGPAYVLTYELLDTIPSLDDPGRSVAQDTFEFWRATPWYDRTRLVEHGRIVDGGDWGLRNRDRADLVKLMVGDEARLDDRRIDECFEPPFFDANFWLMWAGMFGFETWHSAAELRRYLLRFLRLFPDLETMQIIQSTRYNGHDSIVRPLQRWLQAQGVKIDTGVEVTDLEFAPAAGGGKAVTRILTRRDGRDGAIAVGAADLVIVTLGSMTAGSCPGSMDTPPPPVNAPADPAWTLWRRLADKDSVFGRPQAFCGEVERTRWVTFTVTDREGRFARCMEAFSGSPAGQGGLVTLKDSAWRLTFHVYAAPAFPGQPTGTQVWWGYGLHADRPGDHVAKAMVDCSGREILVELLLQLGLQAELPGLLDTSICIPCLLPYATSQFMPRRPGDRPQVVPPGMRGLAVVGQYCEIPDDVVFTAEYSVHSARIAVVALLGLAPALPPSYVGLEHPNALVEALRRILA